ncbi:MAG: periplasmic heavy metal sensor [Candidatus Krumholzibacteriota bacterium]|nr:periplasmic heavy metal sensor [Candidatus Krumholzibacteriota bacterium]
MRTFKLFMIVLVLTAFVVSPLMADESKNCYRRADRDRSCLMAGLDSEHASALHKLKLENERELVDLKAEIKKIKLDMKAEMINETPEAEKLEKLAGKMASAKGELHKKRIRFLFEAKKVLPEKEWKLFLRKHIRHGMGNNQMCGKREGAFSRGHRGSSMHKKRGECPEAERRGRRS